MLGKVKDTIDECRRAVNKPKNVYASLNAKILDFCVTRWTVRADSLKNIMKNYLALQTLFATILTDKVEKKGVNGEKRAEISGLVHHMQKFEFFFGLKLSIALYTIVDKSATNLQGDGVNISVALRMVRDLIDELTKKRDDFDDFWDEVVNERKTINELADDNEILQNFNIYDGIEEPQCPRAQLKSINGSSDEPVVNIY